MTHERCRDQLVDLLYGELSRREAAAVEEHLAACEACRAERDRLGATRAAMQALPPPEPPAGGDLVLLAAARAAAAERKRDSVGVALRRFGGRLALGTGLAALAAYAFLVWAPGPTLRERAAEERAAPEAVSVPPEPREEPKAAPAAPRAEAEEAPAAVPARPPPTIAQREKQSLRMDDPSPAARMKAVASSPRAGEREPAPSAGPSRAPAAAPSAESSLPAKDTVGRVVALNVPSPARAGEGRGEGGDRVVPPSSPIARAVEQRHARGELSDAQKRFDPCPAGGGDRRRLAWLDPYGRVLKLQRERQGGVLVEEWFDDGGRLREAVVRGASASGPWVRRITVSDGGEEVVEDTPAGALAPEAPPPALVRREPAKVFFSSTGCDAKPER